MLQALWLSLRAFLPICHPSLLLQGYADAPLSHAGPGHNGQVLPHKLLVGVITMEKTAAAYIRVSTDDQLEYSPDSQLRAIREYAGRHGLLLPQELVFMEEEGRSGRKAATRPQFLRMIGAAKSAPRPFDVILIWKFSRFARSRQDSIVYKSMLRKQCGVEVVSVTEQLGDDKMSILIEAMIEAMDEYYSINLAEEVRRGMAERAGRGRPVSIPAFGYRMEEGRYVPDPATAPLVPWLYREYAGGKSVGALAGELEAMGVRTRRGNRMTGRNVEYLLGNPVYVGKIRWSPQGAVGRGPAPSDVLLAQGEHTALVEEALWARVQSLLARKTRPRPPAKGDPAPFLLQGLVRCGTCGGALCRKTATSLQCHNYCAGKCSRSHSISIDVLTAQVREALVEDLPALESLPLLLPVPCPGPAADLEGPIRRQREALDRIQAAYEAGADSLEEYREKKARAAAALEALEALEATRRSPPPPAGQPELGLTLPQLLATPTLVEAGNLVLGALLEPIVLYREEDRFTMTYRL